MGLVAFPIGRWREADGAAELAGECGLVAVAAAKRDFSDGL